MLDNPIAGYTLGPPVNSIKVADCQQLYFISSVVEIKAEIRVAHVLRQRNIFILKHHGKAWIVHGQV